MIASMFFPGIGGVLHFRFFQLLSYRQSKHAKSHVSLNKISKNYSCKNLKKNTYTSKVIVGNTFYFRQFFIL
jgi:hypothetical protein